MAEAVKEPGLVADRLGDRDAHDDAEHRTHGTDDSCLEVVDALRYE
jgi:hypothetical protein